MEATEEQTFLDKLRPPKLEDTGFENCALPPDAIKQAFHKAATAAKSIISVSQEDDCLNDPWPTTKDSSDKLIGIDKETDSPPPSSCAVEKGGGCNSDCDKDKVIVGTDDDVKENEDDVVGTTVPEEGESCVDGMQGLKIGEKDMDNKENEDDDEEDNEKEKPILVEGFV